MLWGQDISSPEPQRFREEGLLWLDPPWWGQKLAEGEDAV